MSETVEGAAGQRATVECAPHASAPTPGDVERTLCTALGFDLVEATRRAWRLAIRLTGNPEAAEDLCQRVFEKLARKAASGTLTIASGTGGAYLNAAIANTFREEYKRATALKRGGGEPDAVLELGSQERSIAVSLDCDPAQVVEDAEYRAAIDRAIAKLRPEHRRIMLMLVQGGFSIAEMSKMLDVPESTIRSRIESARQDIRSHMRRSGWSSG